MTAAPARVAWTQAVQGLALTFVVLLVSAAGAITPLGSRAALLCVLLVGGIAVTVLRAPTLYVSFAFWVWMLAPLIRRLVDLNGGYAADSAVLLAPVAVVLPGAVVALLQPLRRVTAEFTAPLTCSLLTVAYGFAVGVVLNDPSPAIVGAASWAAPLLFALYLTVQGPTTEDLLPLLATLAWCGAVVLGIYGTVQWFVLPEWDKQWLLGADLASQGLAEAKEVRVFSTLNSSGPFATVIAALLLVAGQVHRNRWLALALMPGYLALGLSLVRSAWIGLAVAVVIGLLLGTIRLRTVILAAAAATVVVLTIGGPVVNTVQDRFDATVQDGASDASAAARLDYYQQAFPVVASEVTGLGTGGAGNSVETEPGEREGELRLADVDSGLIETLLTFGIVAGLMHLGAALIATVRLARLRLRAEPVQAAWITAAISVLVQIVFGNALVGVSGLVFWTGLAALARTAVQDRTPQSA